ncbi:MAG TPA: histidinol-phosphate transaminase [Polyangiaceae bacterium]
MTDVRLTRAIVLAAGLGQRFGEGGVPKPLRPVAKVPLVVRVLRALQGAGIRQAVLVLGHEDQRVRRAVAAEPSLGLELSFAYNAEYEKKNGVSLLAAAQYVDCDCVLSMADHLYSRDLVRRLLSAPVPAGACALGVDYDVDGCFDLDDATKVVVRDGRIDDIGKELERYDAIDTGVFRIGPALIAELEELYRKHGDCSLSDGVRSLSKRGRFLACDVGDARWIDVDTPQALERAEAMLTVFGDGLGDDASERPAIDPEGIEAFAPSWVRAATPYNDEHFEVADRQHNALRMMSNESPFAPSPRVVNAVMEAVAHGNLYPGGARLLRRKLGERAGLGEDGVLLGAGSTELIDVVTRTFVAPGEEAVLSVPTFSMYEARVRTVGGIPVLVPMTANHEHDVFGLIRSVNERTKLFFVCTPNNPTGNSMPESELRRILRLGLPTVIDEAYYELGNSGSYAHLIRDFPNAIVLRTFSKAFGLAGFRIGYALGHPAVVRLLSRVKVPWNLSAVSIAATNAALDDEAELRARTAELRLERSHLLERLAKIPGILPVPSEGNFVLVDISATAESAERFVARVLEHGVLIRSLGVHHAERSYVRVTVGTREQNDACARALLRTVLELGPAASPGYLSPADAE